MRITNAVELCNVALFRVKAPRITGLDDNSLSGEGCRLCYDQARESALSEYAWDFALTRAVLTKTFDGTRLDGETDAQHAARIVAANLFGYAHSYSLPDNNLRVVRMYDGNDHLIIPPEASSRPPYRYEDGAIITSIPAIKLRYVRNEGSVALFSPLFKDLLIVEVAARLCLFFEDSGSRHQALMAEADLYRRRAKVMDSQQTLSDFSLPHTMEYGF